jgi:hypothetical protein
MTEKRNAAVWVRVVVAASVLWILVALGIVFAEYLFRESLAEHYFWTLPGGGLDLLATTEQQIRNLEPRTLQIIFLLFGPVAVFWTLGWLIAWAKHGQR